MPKLSAPEVEALIRQGLPMASDSNIRIEAVDNNFARLRLPVDQSMSRPGGSVAGPTLMTAADAAMYAAILATAGPELLAMTTDMNIHFLKRPALRDIIAEAHIIKLGKRLAVLRVELYSDGVEEPVAHVTGSYSLPPPIGS